MTYLSLTLVKTASKESQKAEAVQKDDEDYTEIDSARTAPERSETLKEALKETLNQPKVTQVYRLIA